MAGAALSAPFAPVWRPKARAQEGMNLICVYSGNSFVHPDVWTPGPGFSLPEIFAPLRGYEDRMMLVDGISNHTGRGHDAAGGMFTGHENNIPNEAQAWAFTNPGTSIDYHVAAALGGSVRIPVLHAGALTNFVSGQGHLYPFYNGGVRESYTAHPQDLFTTAFGASPAPEPGMPDVEPIAIRQRRRILEANAATLARQIVQATGIRRLRFETHLRQVETELSLLEPSMTPLAPSCTPTRPTLPAEYPSEARPLQRESAVMNRWADDTIHAHIDVMVQALRCGATRVGTLQIGDSGQQMIQPGIVEPTTGYGSHAHDLIHAVNGTDSHFWDARLKFEQWTTSHVRYLLDALGDQLSRTIVLYFRPIGHNHDNNNIPAMLFGGDGTHFTPRRHANMGGTSHLGLLRAVGEMMDVDMGGFGAASDTTAAFSL